MINILLILLHLYCRDLGEADLRGRHRSESEHEPLQERSGRLWLPPPTGVGRCFLTFILMLFLDLGIVSKVDKNQDFPFHIEVIWVDGALHSYRVLNQEGTLESSLSHLV